MDNPNTPFEKVCSKCEEPKILSEFAIDKKGKYGHSAQCKDCVMLSRGKTRKKKLIPREGYKYCSKCHEEKPLNEFYSSKDTKAGFASRCKICDGIAHGYEVGKKAYLKDIPKEPDGMRWCTTCEEMKPKDEFGWIFKNNHYIQRRECNSCKRLDNKRYVRENIDKIIAYRNKTKDYRRIFNKQYYSENREERKNANLEWQKLNPEKYKQSIDKAKSKKPEHYKKLKVIRGQRRRALKEMLPNTLTVEQWNWALEYWNHSCSICGCTTRHLDADHWLALSKGGGTIIENIVPVCGGENGCNNSKGDKDAVTWLFRRYPADEAQAILDRVVTYFAAAKERWE